MGNNKVIVTEEKEHLKKVQMIIKEQIDNVRSEERRVGKECL